jgi:hypothetical protein
MKEALGFAPPWLLWLRSVCPSNVLFSYELERCLLIFSINFLLKVVSF